MKYWTARDLRPDDVDVFSIIKTRADRYLARPLPNVKNRIEPGDSRVGETFTDMPKASFIITSPPYLGTRTYLPDQWLRLWFLGGPDHVNYRYPEDQLKRLSATIFAAELGQVWKNMAARATEGARLIIRYGGIHDRFAYPMDSLKRSLVDSGWRIDKARKVPDSAGWRRQARQFRAEPKMAIPERDVYCHRD